MGLYLFCRSYYLLMPHDTLLLQLIFCCILGTDPLTGSISLSWWHHSLSAGSTAKTYIALPSRQQCEVGWYFTASLSHSPLKELHVSRLWYPCLSERVTFPFWTLSTNISLLLNEPLLPQKLMCVFPLVFQELLLENRNVETFKSPLKAETLDSEYQNLATFW